MSCWRVLQLSDQPEAEQIPQLLIKPRFDSDAYSVFLTDLSNIWSEELDLAGIVDRAQKEESPIEVSKQDTAQLAILLENVRNSLATNDDTSCYMTRNNAEGITLHTTISLPEPLDSLRWKFHLCKRTAVTLKDELILPLLVSSHIQHDRINSLVSTVADKDRAITRLVDQYESSNLDLAAAFPSIGSMKSGRRVVKREQAARHVPGLQVFDEEAWKCGTAELQDTDVSTLGLFQEALSECTPKVPPQLLAKEENDAWWTTMNTVLKTPRSSFKANTKAKAKPPPKPAKADSETEEDETEDEFEVHENFKSRPTVKPSISASKPTSSSASKAPVIADGGTTDEEEDDGDLDAPPRSQSQPRTPGKAPPIAASSTPEPEASRPPGIRNTSRKGTSSPPVKPARTEKPKAKGFKIGGKSKKAEPLAPTITEDQDTSHLDNGRAETPLSLKPKTSSEAPVETKPARKGFKIGGKGKAAISKPAGLASQSPSKSRDDSVTIKSPSVEPRASVPTRLKKEPSPVEEEREETAEEKAERKRMELKRKNEEATKKQAQNKRKKRF